MIAVAAWRLCVARGGEIVVGPADFRLASGEALAVTGENGAGKSTLLRALAGLLPLASGRLEVEGATAGDGEPALRLAEAAHYLGHRNAMKAAMPVGANLAFWRRFLRRPGAGGMSVDAALDAVGLLGTALLPFGYLSAGQQRRAAIARLLVAHRPVWILDEPTAALDAPSQATVARLIGSHLAGGGLLIAATHQPLGIPAAALRLERRAGGNGALLPERLLAAEGWL